MPQTIPFIVPLTFALSANGQGTLSYSVPQQWKVHIKKIWQDSTGAFDFVGLQNNNGLQYTSATVNTPIPSSFVQQPDTADISFNEFEIPIDLDGGQILNVLVKDTSGSGNTVNLLLSGVADIT